MSLMTDLEPDDPITPEHIKSAIDEFRKSIKEVPRPAPTPLKDHTSHLIEVYVYQNGRVEINRPQAGVHIRKRLSVSEVSMFESLIQSVGTLELCQTQ